MAGTILGLSANDLLNDMKHTTVSVTNASTLVCPKNSKRRSILVINDGNVPMYISFGKPAVAHEGIRINENGGSMVFSICHSTLVDMNLYAIHESNGTKKLLLTEGF